MKISDIEQNECCGCSACINACPKSAISVQTDKQGFLYPQIDNSNCIDCGICYKVCKQSLEHKYPVLKCYAAKNTNLEVVMSCSSGGVVDAFCKTILNEHGVVYGAGYNENFELVYKKARTIDECHSFRGSKYVQANPGKVYEEILTDLKSNVKVLYIGPSCYVAGLRSFLEQRKCDENNLYTIDFICHGVPSPGVFAKYVQFVNQDNTLKDIIFRNKKDKNGEKMPVPWKFGNYNCALVYKNGRREVNTLKTRIFLNLFTSNNCLRPHCYCCDFIGTAKAGDITVADYWGIEKVHSDFADNYGVSAVMIHTMKGQSLFENTHNIDCIKSSVEKISLKQGMLRAASPKGECYDEFWNDFYNNDFSYIAKKYGDYSFMGMVRHSKLYSLYSRIRYGE